MLLVLVVPCLGGWFPGHPRTPGISPMSAEALRHEDPQPSRSEVLSAIRPSRVECLRQATQIVDCMLPCGRRWTFCRACRMTHARGSERPSRQRFVISKTSPRFGIHSARSAMETMPVFCVGGASQNVLICASLSMRASRSSTRSLSSTHESIRIPRIASNVSNRLQRPLLNRSCP